LRPVCWKASRPRGKQVTPGNIAYYAQNKFGKGVAAPAFSKPNPLHPAAQINGRSRLISLTSRSDMMKARGTTGFGEVLASEAEDPSATGARNLDWQAFVAKLDELARGDPSMPRR